MINKVKDKLMTREMIFFVFGGASAFLIDFGLLNFEVYILHFDTLLFGFVSVPNLISATVAVIYNFIIQKFFAFKSEDKAFVKGELTKFIAVQVFSIAFFGGLVFGIFLNLGLSVPIAKIVTTAIQMFSSYFFYKYFVFKKKVLLEK